MSRTHPMSRLDRRGLVALTGMTAAYAMAQPPAIIDLGVLPGGTESYAHAVSADGSAVAGVSGSAAGARAFRWTAAGGLENLGVLPGGLSSAGNGISADGRAVAGASGSSLGDRAFRWTAEAGIQALAPLPGGITSSGSCISGDGLTVGGSSDGIDAVRWTTGAGAEVVLRHGSSGGKFPSYTVWATTTAINGDGLVLALNTYIVPWDGEAGYYAWRLAPGGMDGVGSYAYAVSADGAALAGYTFGPWWEPSYYHAFRWTAAGGPQDLGVLSPGGSTAATAISGDGRVAVGADGDIAFLWTSALGMVDLNTYLPSVGVDLTGWVLTDARGLNTDGSVIVGNGYLNGQARGWRVTIPAPPTCYADCDGSTSTPTLNVNDFACFLDRFAAGDAYANCDGSTAPPVLNVLDFACFLNRFAAACP